MARKGLLENNQRRLSLSIRYAEKRKNLKEKIKDRSSSMEERMKLVHSLSRLTRNSSPVRYRNRCSETGRPRGFHSFCGLSRIALRNRARKGDLAGFRGSSW